MNAPPDPNAPQDPEEDDRGPPDPPGSEESGEDATDPPAERSGLPDAGSDAPDPGAELTGSVERTRLFLLLALGAGALYLLSVLLGPLLPALVLAGVLAILVRPAYRPLERWLGRRDLAAFVGTVLVVVGVLLPLLGISVAVVEEVRAGFAWATGQAEALLSRGALLPDWLNRAIDVLGLDRTTLSRSLQEQMQQLASTVAQRTIGVLSGLGGGLLQGGAALFTLFYFLKDGPEMLRRIEWLIPLDEEGSRAVVQRARDVTYATLYGTVAVAAAQGLLMGVAFWALGIQGAALWGVVTGVLAILPFVGPPFVWGPAALVLIAQDEIFRGLVLLGVGVVVVGTVDNLLRTILVSERAQLHPLVVFLSVIGGLIAFGAVGVLVGPVVFVLALMILEMARLALEPELGLLEWEGSSEG